MDRKRPVASFDWAIKKKLRDKSNRKILEGLLSELLRQNVTVKNILESEGNKNYADSRSNKVDILCEDESGALFLMEIQYDRELDYFYRMSYGASKLITDYLKSGENYDKIKKVYSVNILYFNLGQGKDYLYRGTNEFTGVYQNDRLQVSDDQKRLYRKKYVREFFPIYYIIQVSKFENLVKNRLDEWIYYFKNDSLPKNFKAKGLKELEATLKEDAMNPAERADYKTYLKNRSIAHGVAKTIESDRDYAIEMKKKAIQERDVAVKQAEQSKEQAEQSKEQAEQSKEQAKQSKEQAEQSKEQAEQSKEQAEQSKEQAKQSKEQAKQSKEQAKQSKEQAEQSKEQAKQSKEQAKQSKEQAKQSKEQAKRSEKREDETKKQLDDALKEIKRLKKSSPADVRRK